ncbi:hypothetical protein J4Q44_G00062620, partial [Coregonus suidteri]
NTRFNHLLSITRRLTRDKLVYLPLFFSDSECCLALSISNNTRESRWVRSHIPLAIEPSSPRASNHRHETPSALDCS